MSQSVIDIERLLHCVYLQWKVWSYIVLQYYTTPTLAANSDDENCSAVHSEVLDIFLLVPSPHKAAKILILARQLHCLIHICAICFMRHILNRRWTVRPTMRMLVGQRDTSETLAALTHQELLCCMNFCEMCIVT